MAITNMQKNVIQEMQELALLIVQLKSRARNVVEMYANENVTAVVDADLQNYPGLGHLSAAELQGAKNSLDTIAAAIGEYVAGTPATKLIKICPKIP